MPRRETKLLALVLDTPDLVAAVEALAPAEFAALVEHVGLEDAAEIASVATTDQWLHLADTSLWQSDAPGAAERFSPERFAVWLEMMLEAGERFAAERLLELPDELVALALQSHFFVLDVATLERYMAGVGPDRANLIEKALDSAPYFELGEYLLLARQPDGWHSVVTALVALQEVDADQLERWMARCCHASTELIDDSGDLYDVLTSEEMLEVDAEADRLDRRAAQGYVAPADAAAFLASARAEAPESALAAVQPDPLTRAYFRQLTDAAMRVVAGAHSPRTDAMAATGSAPALRRLLEAHGVIGAGPAAPLLPAAPSELLREAATPSSLMQRAMSELRKRDPEVHAQRMRELGYLSNVLIAGAPYRGRRYRPREAAQAVVEACARGLGYLLARRSPDSDLAALLAEVDAVKLFRSAWSGDDSA